MNSHEICIAVLNSAIFRKVNIILNPDWSGFKSLANEISVWS